eukprot:12125316-Ditylum_brightwellii.AAC.1
MVLFYLRWLARIANVHDVPEIWSKAKVARSSSGKLSSHTMASSLLAQSVQNEKQLMERYASTDAQNVEHNIKRTKAFH